MNIKAALEMLWSTLEWRKSFGVNGKLNLYNMFYISHNKIKILQID